VRHGYDRAIAVVYPFKASIALLRGDAKAEVLGFQAAIEASNL
jgi:hypothetical protein